MRVLIFEEVVVVEVLSESTANYDCICTGKDKNAQLSKVLPSSNKNTLLD
jgi:hypothetical protein